MNSFELYKTSGYQAYIDKTLEGFDEACSMLNLRPIYIENDENPSEHMFGFLNETEEYVATFDDEDIFTAQNILFLLAKDEKQYAELLRDWISNMIEYAYGEEI